MLALDLNSDLGEGFGVYRLGDDNAMMDVVTSANVACGFHAGDPLIMHETVSRALSRGVDVGAHPSLFDLWGFGRRQIHGERPSDIEKMLVYQIGAIEAVARSADHRVTHVKSHGALTSLAASDLDLAMAIARAVRTVNRDLTLVTQSGNACEKAAERLGLRIAREVYADRTYDDDGSLASRRLPGAVIHDPEDVIARVLRMIEDGAVTSVNGKRIPVRIDTICVHGDTPGAVIVARRLREALTAVGVTLKPLSQLVQ